MMSGPRQGLAIMSSSCVLLLLLLLLGSASAASQHNITAVFAFGDSTVDPGNNNHIGTLFVSNHPPYGRDLAGRQPTGRFTNGRLVTDFVVSHLGLKQYLPAYLDPALTDEDLVTGASFASSGSGIDDETAALARLLTMGEQLRNFKNATERIKARVGPQEARRIVNNALFVISAGTNDVLNNFYWLPFSTRKFQFSLAEYHNFLLTRLHHIFLDLYDMGAHKFVVAGMPPTGCLPLQMTAATIFPLFGPHTHQRRCIEQQNADSRAYNEKLRALIAKLDSQLEGAKFVYTDIYGPLMEMIQNPSAGGFDVSTEGCCGLGTVEAGPLCRVLLLRCLDPSRYIFWDSIHPTEAAYSRISDSIIRRVLPGLMSARGG